MSLHDGNDGIAGGDLLHMGEREGEGGRERDDKYRRGGELCKDKRSR